MAVKRSEDDYVCIFFVAIATFRQTIMSIGESSFERKNVPNLFTHYDNFIVFIEASMLCVFFY
jgi:hypothetical protein